MKLYDSLAAAARPDQEGAVFAVLRRAERKSAKTGAPFYVLELSDQDATVAARIWQDQADAFAAAESLSPGTPVKIAFRSDVWKDVVQLRVTQIRAAAEDDPGFVRTRLFGEVPEWLEGRMPRELVFDIETVPDRGIREMPPTIVKALAEHAERRELDEAAVRGLSPFFGKIVSLAFGNGSSEAGEEDIVALVVPRPDDNLESLPPFARPMTEAELIRTFWTLAAAAETVVTYNGRGFDVPFLVVRSLIHGIPARVDLISNRFSLKPHLDLFDLLGQRGRGPSNLDVVCWALGIESPKGEMDGSMVAPAYEAGRLAEIATYNRHDVRATAEVFRRTRDLLLRHREDWS